MSKKVLILSGSPRKNGNSDFLCEKFMEGAQTAGHEVEKIFVSSKKIGFCRACYACRGTGKCFQQDDMKEILASILAADVLVMASPVYFYAINGQMKTLIDRTLPRWTEIKDKELYYILTAAEDSEAIMQRSLECFRGFADCFSGMQEKGVLLAHGLYEKNAAKESPYVQQAYDMGRNV
ncbi:MAG: flavodoxin family protein [Selenomonas sp.]|nr:flavodoxin family protein [Selenomonas sp.]